MTSRLALRSGSPSGRRPPPADLRFTTIATAMLLAAGCSDVYSDPITSAATPPPSIRINVDASASAPLDRLSSCPVSAIEGATCTQAGLACEFGASPDMECNTTLACTPTAGAQGLAWTSRPSVLCPSYACPDRAGAIGAVHGTPCSVPNGDAGPNADSDELVCPMSDGLCACTTGIDGAHKHARSWVCLRPSSGCSIDRPLAGHACTARQTCDYGSCAFKHGLRMSCDGIAWRTEGASCN